MEPHALESDGTESDATESDATESEIEPLTVAVVHRNSVDAVIATVEQFLAIDAVRNVVIADNGTVASELVRLRTVVADHGDRVELLELGQNTGFGPGANAALRRWLELDGAGRTEWAALVPHDVELFNGCLERITAALRSDPMIGLACADVGDGRTPVIDPYFGGMTRPAAIERGWEDADYPHGTLMMLRRACVDDIGLFDERYFAYCEEADLAVRARASGWRVGLVRGARVQNLNLGSSVAVVDYLQQRNTLLLVREMSGRYHATIRLGIAVGQLISGVRHPDDRPAVFNAARRRAIVDHLRKRYGPPPASVTG